MLQVSGIRLVLVSKAGYRLDTGKLIFNEKGEPASEGHKSGLCTLMLSSRQHGGKIKGLSRQRRHLWWEAEKAFWYGIIHILHIGRQRDAVY